MKHFLDILKKNKLWIIIYILLGIVLALLNAFSASYFKKVLDEDTSAMDNVTEELVMKNLIEFLKNKTSIIIAHRLNTIKDVEKIYVFKAGEIVAVGTFKELLNNNKYFRHLWNAAVENKNDLVIKQK